MFVFCNRLFITANFVSEMAFLLVFLLLSYSLEGIVLYPSSKYATAHDDLLESINQNSFICCLFIHLSKEFDTIDQKILIGTELFWITLFWNGQGRVHRQLFYKLQPRQTAPAGKSDVIGNDKKASSRNTWVIKQKNGNSF